MQRKEVPKSQRETARSAARADGLPALPDGVDWPDGSEPLVLSVDRAAPPHDVLDIELPAVTYELGMSVPDRCGSWTAWPVSPRRSWAPLGETLLQTPSAVALLGERTRYTGNSRSAT
ncbi:hypothetical protein R6V09_23765 [Streptomyces sp. W16]|uniref:hypothetical protein n=1 Tax=Streptomyces sp. W16 TaxID=3076631 RepID=UPI00295C397F|nr:hypothetical protein [Streptomyces sp. W16]MDV9173121.1 hypothetical protein [Streptomyces sp. W16]